MQGTIFQSTGKSSSNLYSIFTNTFNHSLYIFRGKEISCIFEIKGDMMKILLVSPKIPSTFWSFRNALKFVSKKSSEPPLGLLTIANMLPKEWPVKLVDMNVRQLKDKDILWADYVFLTGMNVQRESFQDVLWRCQSLGVKVVAGGPMMTTEHETFSGIDHLILNEAEETLPMFLKDLEEGHPKPMYTSPNFPDLDRTPIPRRLSARASAAARSTANFAALLCSTATVRG